MHLGDECAPGACAGGVVTAFTRELVEDFWLAHGAEPPGANNFVGKQKPSQKEHLQNLLPSQDTCSEQANSPEPTQTCQSIPTWRKLFQSSQESLGGNTAPPDPPGSLVLDESSSPSFGGSVAERDLQLTFTMKKKSICLILVEAKEKCKPVIAGRP